MSGRAHARHGLACHDAGSVFLGHAREKTCGGRIIGDDHCAIGIRFEGLNGDRYRVAFSMVRSILNSPTSDYHHIRLAELADNTFVDCVTSCRWASLEGQPETTLSPIVGVIADNRIVQPQPGFFSAAMLLANFRIGAIAW